MKAFLGRVCSIIANGIMKIIMIAVVILGVYVLGKAACIAFNAPGDWGMNHSYAPKFDYTPKIGP